MVYASHYRERTCVLSSHVWKCPRSEGMRGVCYQLERVSHEIDSLLHSHCGTTQQYLNFRRTVYGTQVKTSHVRKVTNLDVTPPNSSREKTSWNTVYGQKALYCIPIPKP